MPARRLLCFSLVLFFIPAALEAQVAPSSQDAPAPQLLPGSARPTAPAPSKPEAVVPQTISLSVPKGTSLQVALERELRIQRIGQPVYGKLVEPVYAFDQLVIPVGSQVRGEVTKIAPVSGGRRTLAGLDGDFTPSREIEIRFTDLTLAGTKHLKLDTSVTPGSGQILKLVSSPDKESKKTVKDAASEKAKEAKQQARDQWDSAMKQLKTPGRVQRLKRYAEAQLPIHHQYVPAGTMYFAELREPLDFGTKTLSAQIASSLGGELPDGSVVQARLVTPLSSATAQKGQEVDAVLTRPLLDGERLILPQGSRLVGSVRQVQPARRLKKNGQLRIAFEQVVPPDGLEQKVQATLIGVQAGKDGNVKLDTEGGAEATNSKTRYANVAVSLSLAAISTRADGDDPGGGASGHTSGRMAGGVGGFKLAGAVAGALIQSRAFGYTMGAYGAGMSIYRNFMARGHEVVFPKNTAMEVSLGTRASAANTATASPSGGGL